MILRLRAKNNYWLPADDDSGALLDHFFGRKCYWKSWEPKLLAMCRLHGILVIEYDGNRRYVPVQIVDSERVVDSECVDTAAARIAEEINQDIAANYRTGGK